MFAKNIAILLAISGTYASPLSRRDACSDACTATYNTCRSKPNANRSTCASEYSSCLGFVPFNSEGSLVTPTACSVKSSAPAPTASPAADCPKACSSAYDTCRGKPGANRATCAAEYSSCLGYIPFNSEGSLVTPTACSVTPTASAPATTSTASSADCAKSCSAAYDTCRGKPDANRATCAAEYSSCLGYVPFNGEGSLVTPTACSASTSKPTATSTSIEGIPGGCNPAHPGSCPTPTGIPGGCNPAHPGSCPTPTGIPGGCNPAHPGSCPTPATNAAPAPTQAGKGWTVKQLTRYCSEDGTGCDYNFAISTNDGAADTRCTVIRIDVKDALTESWYNIPCTTGSSYKISWGYSAQFAVPFAVMTVVDEQAKAQAYFGVSDINGKPVTAGNPKGSGNFGDIGPQPVYTS